MGRGIITEEELRDTVIAYGTSWCAASPMPDPGLIFSERYETKKKHTVFGKKTKDLQKSSSERCFGTYSGPGIRTGSSRIQ